MSDDRQIVCSRVVFVDSEFDAKKGRGERPGFPVCICAIEIDQDGRETEHRLAAPYPARPPWDRGDPFLTIGFALSAEAGSFLHVGWKFPDAGNRPLCRVHGDPQHRNVARRGQQATRSDLDSSLSALRRRRNGQDIQGRHARARLYENQSHSGRNCALQELLHRRQSNGDEAVPRDAAAH